MKVVDEKPFGHEFQCRCCGSQLVAEIGDVRVGYFGANYGGDTPSRMYYVTCPVCGTDHTLEHSEVPPNVSAAADRKEKER